MIGFKSFCARSSPNPHLPIPRHQSKQTLPRFPNPLHWVLLQPRRLKTASFGAMQVMPGLPQARVWSPAKLIILDRLVRFGLGGGWCYIYTYHSYILYMLYKEHIGYSCVSKKKSNPHVKVRRTFFSAREACLVHGSQKPSVQRADQRPKTSRAAAHALRVVSAGAEDSPSA